MNRELSYRYRHPVLLLLHHESPLTSPLPKNRLLVVKAKGHTFWWILSASLCADFEPSLSFALIFSFPSLSLDNQQPSFLPGISISSAKLRLTSYSNPNKSTTKPFVFEAKQLLLEARPGLTWAFHEVDLPTASCQPSIKNQRNKRLIRLGSRHCHHGLYAWRMRSGISFLPSSYFAPGFYRIIIKVLVEPPVRQGHGTIDVK